MDTLVQVTGIALVLLWLGLRKPDVTQPVRAVIALLDLLVLITSVIAFGWLGLGLTLGATVLGVLGWSMWLAMKKEEILAYAATQSGTTKNEMESLWRRLKGRDKALRLLGPMEVARLICLLSVRARSPAAIEQMALPIALLWVVHRPPLDTLVERFDRIMRLYSEPPERAMKVADVIATAAQRSAATFDDVLDALIAADGPCDFGPTGRELSVPPPGRSTNPASRRCRRLSGKTLRIRRRSETSGDRLGDVVRLRSTSTGGLPWPPSARLHRQHILAPCVTRPPPHHRVKRDRPA